MTHTSLTLVIEHFPDLRNEVAGLFAQDEVFQELCEDYESCSQALARQESNEALRREYAALRLRLETELLSRLHDAQGPDARK
jgi:uncharacterized protein YdcH (DUF465 family)